MVSELYDWLFRHYNEGSKPLLPVSGKVLVNPPRRRRPNLSGAIPLSSQQPAPHILQPKPLYHQHIHSPLLALDWIEFPANQEPEPGDPPISHILRYSSTGPRRLESLLNCSAYRRLAVRRLTWSHLPFLEEYHSGPGWSRRWCRSLELWPTFEVTAKELYEFLSIAVDSVEYVQVEGDVAIVVFENSTAAAAVNVLTETLILKQGTPENRG